MPEQTILRASNTPRPGLMPLTICARLNRRDEDHRPEDTTIWVNEDKRKCDQLSQRLKAQIWVPNGTSHCTGMTTIRKGRAYSIIKKANRCDENFHHSANFGEFPVPVPASLTVCITKSMTNISTLNNISITLHKCYLEYGYQFVARFVALPDSANTESVAGRRMCVRRSDGDGDFLMDRTTDEDCAEAKIEFSMPPLPATVPWSRGDIPGARQRQILCGSTAREIGIIEPACRINRKLGKVAAPSLAAIVASTVGTAGGPGFPLYTMTHSEDSCFGFICAETLKGLFGHDDLFVP